MNNPAGRKTFKVSTDVHSAVHRLATTLGASADEAIRLLVDPSTVRLPLSTEQHATWTRYADAAGIPLAEWITHRVEAAIQYGTDQGTMTEVLKGVRVLLARTAPSKPKPKPKPEENH